MVFLRKSSSVLFLPVNISVEILMHCPSIPSSLASFIFFPTSLFTFLCYVRFSPGWCAYDASAKFVTEVHTLKNSVFFLLFLLTNFIGG
ncbi:hypothetical protein DPMN_158812 [Dreissena polymorpha]|uniref:Uncharacterized protein n=1 Tax=Dreissena polymorpha TaxID=45954 RepID=A0A9D4EKI4_DREPO|nr:hypothetical protein DPMN_158812 [Dreissena polymorpha]